MSVPRVMGAGDEPLGYGPVDATIGTVLLSGSYNVPAEGGGGFLQTPALYTFPGLARIADYTTPIPGFPVHPVYQLDGGGVQIVVDDQTILPPNPSPVLLISAGDVRFDNDGSDVALALRETNGGVWKRIAGTWTRVVSRNDPMPGGTGIFCDFTEVAIRGDAIAFVSRRSNPFQLPLDAGIYTHADGVLEKVATFTGDFAAETPLRFQIAAAGRWFDGEELVFAVEDDAWGAMMRATPAPEPSALLGGAAALALVAALARRSASLSQRAPTQEKR